MATEWLADSYWLQSQSKLPEALAAAQKATEVEPNSGFAWERVAELEFCFGEISKARAALERSLELAPRNAQALALKGFLLAADNRPHQAAGWFDRAIAADSALGNAWLGRGLCRMRRGDSAGGVADLAVAAALEPQRSLLRSYLGKAYTAVDDYPLAGKELKLAINLDPKDPTAWLYSALLKQQQNRINEAIGDLEASQERNDNRSVFRSRLLLDEDLAVSSANLASIYRDAGMTDVSVREAARAVTYDYANASAHLFLSDSYNELRDPTRFNLRYETVWFNELLLANLLSPVGGGRLSQHVSQQEYSQPLPGGRLGPRQFHPRPLRQQVHYASSFRSTAPSAGPATPSTSTTSTTTASAPTTGSTASNGTAPSSNRSLRRIPCWPRSNTKTTVPATISSITTRPTRGLISSFTEYQQPIVVGGWHHEWSPGAHTLLLGGRIATEQYFSDRAARQLLLLQNRAGDIYAADTQPFDVTYHGDSEVYLAELNQIFQWDRVTLSLGGRWQGGSFQTQAEFTNPPAGLASLFNDPVAQASLNEGFSRLTGYGYLTVEPLDRLWLIGGAAYDDITYPDNFRNPPLSAGQAQAIPARAQGRARLEPRVAVHAARRLYQVAWRRERG